ncbi:MAG: endo-1,4-beta-xylanase, partial [Sedimentisphaerales bacterium]|nr:endo-1,4-beta-xylanase [Sedimentisphaerales bacterium]
MIRSFRLATVFLSGCLFFLGCGGARPERSLCAAYKGRFNIAVGLEGRLPEDYSDRELDLIRTQFSVLTPANCMKMYHIQRQEGVFDFEQADAFVAFAAENKQKVLGHCLIWAKDVRTPRWFFENGEDGPTREILLGRMQRHIETVVGRYRGKVPYWDVVNEALADDENFIRPSSYLSVIGEDFIAKAFEYARAADPEAMLIYNDYNLFFENKQTKLKRLLEYFEDHKTPVDAIGIQGHFPKYTSVRRMAESVEAVGFSRYFLQSAV